MENRMISKTNNYIILTVCLFFIASCILFNISLFFGFLGSIIFSSYILVKRGFSIKQLMNMIKIGLKECRMLYVLILLIGATISIWLSSGIVPTMMYYGFEHMKGMNFLFATFIITSIISIFMGTAVGTISTLGIALLGIGKGFGIPEYIILGAIVSGAFIADKISPISGLLNLTLSTTKTRYKHVLKSMMITLIPTYIITAIIFYFIGRGYSISINGTNLGYYQTAILDNFFISPLLLLFPIAVLTMSVLGVKIIPTISLGLLGGIILSLSFQNMSIVDILQVILLGFEKNMTSSELSSIFTSGGIVSMVEVLLIVMGAISLSSIFEGTGLIQPLIDKMFSKVKTKKGLIFKTGLISSILTIVTCDQTVGIILPGRLLKPKYEELGVEKTILARTISDTGTIIAPLFPWNVNALIIGVISGISAMAYSAYAVICYISPVITFFASYWVKSEKTGE